MGFLKNIWTSPSTDWVFAKLPNSQSALGGTPSATISPNQGYISVILKSMRLVNLRVGASRFYGTVYSNISIPHLRAGAGQVTKVISPEALRNIDGRHLDRILSLDHRLAGPIPYRGGDLELEMGLFSIKESDWANQFVLLLTDLSQVPLPLGLSEAIPIAKAITSAFERLSGLQDTNLEVGLFQGFQEISTGIYAVIRGPKSEIDPRHLAIDLQDNKLFLNGKQLLNFPYLVFEIKQENVREFWQEIPELGTKYTELRELVRKGDYTTIENELLPSFRCYLLTSDDLLASDGKAIFERIKVEITEVMGTTITRSIGDKDLPELGNLDPFGPIGIHP